MNRKSLIFGWHLCGDRARRDGLSRAQGWQSADTSEERTGYQVEARFDNIGNLKPRAPVKSAGVVVGRVESIRLDDKTFEGVARLHLLAPPVPARHHRRDLYLRLLGEQFVDLEAGGDSVMLWDEERIKKRNPPCSWKN